MEKIIQQIIEKMIEEVFETLRETQLSDIGRLTRQLSGTIKSSVMNIVIEAIQQMDLALVEANTARKEDGLRIKERNVSRTILTDLGELQYERTYFESTEKQRYYLVDYLIGVEAHERISKELCAQLVQCAADTSMEKAAKNIGVGVSRQTVNNKVLALKEVAVSAVRSEVTPKELHLFADEDHVHLKNGRGAIVPLVTVTEGIDSAKKRHKTKSAIHFEGYGIENSKFSESISSFLHERYDMEQVEHIYMHGDGAKWIRAAKDWLPNVEFVMDGFHLEKRLRKVSRLNGAAPYMKALRNAIREDKFAEFVACCANIDEKQDEKGHEILADNVNFIQNNWEAIVLRLQNTVCGSCTEPLVSHVLSSRLSRNPLAWSEHGLRQMAMIRVYVKNGGVVTSDDIRVSRSKADLHSDRASFKNGFEKYRSYTDKQIGEFLDTKLNWSVFDQERFHYGKLNGTTMLIKSYGLSRYAIASA